MLRRVFVSGTYLLPAGPLIFGTLQGCVRVRNGCRLYLGTITVRLLCRGVQEVDRQERHLRIPSAGGCMMRLLLMQ